MRNGAELQHLREHLELLQRERNLSPAELAAKAIVPLSSVTRVLNGQVTNPGTDVIISLARGLGVTVSELLGDARGRPDRTVTLLIEGTDRVGMLRDISHIIAEQKISITRCNVITNLQENRARFVLDIEPNLKEQVQIIINEITKLPTVDELKVAEEIKLETIYDGIRKLYANNGTTTT